MSRIIKEQTDILELKFNELTLTDEIAQSQIIERYVKAQILTRNEAREQLGLPQHPEANEFLEMTARAAADARANQAGNRQRDTERANNQSDSPATVSGRNAQGEGRASE